MTVTVGRKKQIIILGCLAVCVTVFLAVLLGALAGGFGQRAPQLVFASEQEEFVYDGQPHRGSKWKLVEGGLARGYTVSAEFTAERTEAGSCENAFTVSVLDENGNDVTDTYEIGYQFGTLEILPREIVLSTASAEKEYDGRGYGDFKKDLVQFVRDYEAGNIPVDVPCTTLFRGQYFIPPQADQPLTEIREGALYFCLEQRLVTVRGQIIPLTVKEFEIFALLILNPKRVFTYEMLMELVWHEEYSYYSRKAINNHISNLRKKIRIAPDLPEYVKSVYGVGYKFEV